MGAVVHHQEDHRQALLDRHRHGGQLGAHPAVADQRDHHPVRLGDLHAERGGRAEAHRGRAAGGDEPAVGGQRVALRHAVLVPADVGDQHRVGGQRGAHVGEDALGPQRELVAAAAFGARREQLRPGGADPLAQAGPARTGSAPARTASRDRPHGAGRRRRRRRSRPDSCGRSRPGRCRSGSAGPAGTARCTPGSRSWRRSRRTGWRWPAPRRRRGRSALVTSRPQKPVMPSTSGWSSGSAPLAISECATGMSRCSASSRSASRPAAPPQPAAEVDQRPLGADQQRGDPLGVGGRQAGPRRRARAAGRSGAGRGSGRENRSIGTFEQHRARAGRRWRSRTPAR